MGSSVFRIGMSVMCVNAETFSDTRRGLLQRGKIYKVSEVAGWHTEIQVEGISSFYWRTDRFKVIAFNYKRVESKLP
jgi:hypothetical protein